MIRVLYLLLFVQLTSLLSPVMGQSRPAGLSDQYHLDSPDTVKSRILDQHLLVLEKDELLKECAALSVYFNSKNDHSGYDYVQLILNNARAQEGNYVEAIKNLREIQSRFENRNDSTGILKAVIGLSVAYAYANDKEHTIEYDRKAIDFAHARGFLGSLANAYNNIASDFTLFNMPDSALPYAEKAVAYALESKNQRMITMSMGTLGEVYIAKRDYEKALPLIRNAFELESDVTFDNSWTINDYAEIMLNTGKPDSALIWARRGLETSQREGVHDQLLRAYNLLSQTFEARGQSDSALAYYKTATLARDSLHSTEKTKQLQSLRFEDQLRAQATERDQIEYRNRIRTLVLLGGLAVFVVVAFILFRNARQKQRVNRKLEKTLIDLRSTQTQLIQSEKMASLGELTAGIAHEIQNPLNFVNNFSEVSRELLDEMNAALGKGDFAEAKEISADVIQNLEKITHHGKRADSIVKGMLQHSRSSSGEKELTDINTLCDEYLRLTYHGLRAKDKSFNATTKTGFDPTIVPVKVFPQDLGRVILNLLTNAFYAVNEKKKNSPSGYEPTVSLTTKNLGAKIEIRISDNGDGIPQHIADRIFQPFFTTKPTGAGTGLGLSLAYDIITKGHAGDLTVKSENGAIFTITLPVN